MIRKHGLKVFFLSRFTVGIRTPVYLTAGILRMSFAAYPNLCPCPLPSLLFFGLSYAYGEHLTGLIRRSEIGFTVAVVLRVSR